MENGHFQDLQRIRNKLNRIKIYHLQVHKIIFNTMKMKINIKIMKIALKMMKSIN